MKQTSRFLIGATSSGSGKTTVTLGLLKMLKNRNFNIQPFKCGPDYIDTKFHKLASGSEAINLDLYLSSPQHVKQLYAKYSQGKDVCVIEGVMGLFDGYEKMNGSSAQIAELLNVPVVMVINAKSIAYSTAPLLYGFNNFAPNVNIVGAIFNFVRTESHYSYLKEACADVGIEPLGYLPLQENMEISSRHLGLKFDNKKYLDDVAEEAAKNIERYINVDRLLELTSTETPQYTAEKITVTTSHKIAVASDVAFNFVYHENIEYLKQLGEVVFFSPIHDKKLPDGVDLVYLPGGYPELYLPPISDNYQMIGDIRAYIENGGKVLAECGGMMYLSKSIKDRHGVTYPMVGTFDQTATMQNAKLSLGYRGFEYNGIQVKGHEFHYSIMEENDAPSVTQIYNARGVEVGTKLLRYKNVIAGYTHIYWPEIDLMKLFSAQT